MARNRFALAVGGIAIGAIVLGTVGFQAARPHSHWRDVPDSAYRATQMLTLNFDTGFDRTIPLSLSIARWLAAVTAFTVVLTLVSRVLTQRMRLFVQAQWPGQRVVLLGFGSVNRAIAASLTEYRITAVSNGFSAADRRLAAERGLLLVEADLADEEALRTVRIGRCEAIYVACGTDQLNLEAGWLAARLAGDNRNSNDWAERILVHLSDISLMQQLADARDMGFARGARFSRYSLKQVGARDLLRRARLPQRAAEAGMARVHAVILGYGNQGEALLREIALGGHSTATARPPRITVLDREATRVEARLLASYKTLMDPALLPAEARPQIEVLSAEFEELDPEAGVLAELQRRVEPPTAYLVVTGDDGLNLRVGMRLESAMQRRALRPAPIYVRSWDNLERQPRWGSSPMLHVEMFGEVRVTARHWLRQRRDTLAMAKRLHRSYDETFSAPGAAVPEAEALWRELPDLYRRSDVRAVEHAACKLIDLDLQWRGMAEGVIPAIAKAPRERFLTEMQAGLSEQRAAASGAGAQLWKLATMEHARWMTDRALEGFRPVVPGSSDVRERVRSDVLRRHGLMVAFSQIEEGQRPLDLQLLRLILHESEASGRPIAWPRQTLRLRLEEAATGIADGDDAPTELEIDIPDPFAIDPAVVERAKAPVERWARSARACRVHVVIEEPARFPRKLEKQHFCALDGLLRDRPDGIARDFTWRTGAR